MTLKEELEILRGEPIEIFVGDPMDIPCIETSDPERLCKHPVVSVYMVTFNHEPYIRRAIEGVMMQKTDFEFELVIGEDCSRDWTREICFEYQKKYPDKIRILWWLENVSKLGGNGRRTQARCRGEFVAFCEGDDYWTDEGKLQKQVGAMRSTNACLCVANAEWHCPDGSVWRCSHSPRKMMLTLHDVAQNYFHTSTYLVRRTDIALCAQRHYPSIIYWYDFVQAVCLASIGGVCYLPDFVSVYNWHGNGEGGGVGSRKRSLLAAVQHVQLAECGPVDLRKYFAKAAVSSVWGKARFELRAHNWLSFALHLRVILHMGLKLGPSGLFFVARCALRHMVRGLCSRGRRGKCNG